MENCKWKIKETSDISLWLWYQFWARIDEVVNKERYMWTGRVLPCLLLVSLFSLRRGGIQLGITNHGIFFAARAWIHFTIVWFLVTNSILLLRKLSTWWWTFQSGHLIHPKCWSTRLWTLVDNSTLRVVVVDTALLLDTLQPWWCVVVKLHSFTGFFWNR